MTQPDQEKESPRGFRGQCNTDCHMQGQPEEDGNLVAGPGKLGRVLI